MGRHSGRGPSVRPDCATVHRCLGARQALHHGQGVRLGHCVLHGRGARRMAGGNGNSRRWHYVLFHGQSCGNEARSSGPSKSVPHPHPYPSGLGSAVAAGTAVRSSRLPPSSSCGFGHDATERRPTRCLHRTVAVPFSANPACLRSQRKASNRHARATVRAAFCSGRGQQVILRRCGASGSEASWHCL